MSLEKSIQRSKKEPDDHWANKAARWLDRIGTRCFNNFVRSLLVETDATRLNKGLHYKNIQKYQEGVTKVCDFLNDIENPCGTVATTTLFPTTLNQVVSHK